MEHEYRHKFVAKLMSSLVLGVSLLGAAAIVARTFYAVKSLDNTLQVTGSAKQAVVADSVKWVGWFSRSVPVVELKQGYLAMARDQEAVARFLNDQGITDDQVTVSAVLLDAPFKYNPQVLQQYELRQTVEVRSPDVAKVTAMAKNLQPLVNQDVLFATQSLEYFYSKLPELMVGLLSAAVADARARAERIASSTGKRVGGIRSASMGVVQVMAPSSVDVSDYGSYDTSSIDKEVMVTVKAAFTLR